MWYNDDDLIIVGTRDTRRLARVFEDDPFDVEIIHDNLYSINGDGDENKLNVTGFTNLITAEEKYRRQKRHITTEEARTEEENEIRSCRIENDLSKTPSAVSGNICLEQPRYCGHVDVTKENDCKTVSITDTSIVSQADNLIEEMYTKNVRQNHGNRDYRNVWDGPANGPLNSLRYHKRFMSRSTQHIRETVNEEEIPNDGYQSLPHRRNHHISSERGSSDLFASLPQLADHWDQFDIVVTIDIGTYYSGYAYSYHFLGQNDYVSTMKRLKEHKWKRLPSVLLLNSRTEFHSFGQEAVENFITIERNISPSMSQWLLFDKFKFQLHNFTDIDRENSIKATNGTSVTAVTVFSRTLGYFKCRALNEISKIFGKSIRRGDVRWIVTIPVAWSHTGKIFIQEAAYEAGLCTPGTSSRLTVTYEANAALTWCLTIHPVDSSTKCIVSNTASYVILMNCGGGTIDISIHEIRAENKDFSLINIHKISENIYSSIGIDNEFVQLLNSILGIDFVDKFKLDRPASFIQLLLNFESCKWTLSSSANSQPATIRIPDGFSEMYSQLHGEDIKYAFSEFGQHNIVWHEKEEIIAMDYLVIAQLFQPVIHKIIKQINIILRNRVDESRVLCLYVTGGLARSPILKKAINENFSSRINVIFPDKSPELYVMKGSLQRAISLNGNETYKVPYSYAIGVLKPFQEILHPLDKLVVKNGVEWCCDLLDVIIKKDQILSPGEIILKKYKPANYCQSHIIINIYSMENENSQFVTDNGVHNCGVLHLATLPTASQQPREILFQVTFSGNEFIASILDTTSGRSVQIQLDPVSYL